MLYITSLTVSNEIQLPAGHSWVPNLTETQSKYYSDPVERSTVGYTVPYSAYRSIIIGGFHCGCRVLQGLCVQRII